MSPAGEQGGAGARRGLAGIREDVALAQASVYHAVAREAALAAFGRAYERGHGAAAVAADAAGEAPEYVMATTAAGELVVVAGAGPTTGRTSGRLVAPRELLALLLDDPRTSAVWCDEDDGEGLALTGHAITLGGEPMLLIVARSARCTGEPDGVTEVVHESPRVTEGEWTADALDAYLRAHDGDAVVLAPDLLPGLAELVAETDA